MTEWCKSLSLRNLVALAFAGIALVACQEQLSPTGSVGNLSATHTVPAPSCPMTYFIDNPPADIVNTGGSCGLSWNNACGGGAYGFTWTDVLPVEYTVTSVTVEMSSGTDCHGTGTTLTTSLNGTGADSFSAVQYCSCGGRPGGELIYTSNAPVAAYVQGGSNTFLMTNLNTCFGFFDYPGGIAGLVRITVGCTAPVPPRVERPERPTRPPRR